MAVALYARVSTPRQAEKDLSIPDQLRQLREYCKARSLAVASEYVEPGATATDDRRAVATTFEWRAPRDVFAGSTVPFERQLRHVRRGHDAIAGGA